MNNGHRFAHHRLPIAIWTAMWGTFFGSILLGWQRLPNSDLTGQFHAFAAFQARTLWSGRFPIWSDGSFGGVPFIADTQAAAFYPPRWLTILLGAPGGDLSYLALEWEALLHVWLLGAGVYLLAFQLLQQPNEQFAEPLLAPEPARWLSLLAAVSFGLGGYVTSYPLLQLAVLETFAWLPLILLALRYGVLAQAEHKASNFMSITVAGLLMAVAFTAGHPQTFLHISYMAAAYYLFLAVTKAGWRWQAIGLNGIWLIFLALACSAAAWLPVTAYLPLTVRADATYSFVSSGQSLLNFIQIGLPSALTFWTPEYVGQTVVWLALIMVFGRGLLFGSKPAGREAIFWGTAAFFTAWISLGDKGILWSAWYRVAPGFQLFRQQERVVGITVFCLTMFALYGGVAWWKANSVQQRHILRQAAISVAVFFVAALVFLQLARPEHAAEWRPIWLQQAGLAIIIGTGLRLSVTSRKNGYIQLFISLILLTGADLYVNTLQNLSRVNQSPNILWPQPDWIKTLHNEKDLGRFDPGFLYFTNVGEAYGLRSTRGISPLKPLVLDRLEQIPLARTWPLMNVTHGVFQGDPPPDLDLTLVTAAAESLIPGEARPETNLYRFNQPLPAARMVYQSVVANDLDGALAAVADPQTDLANQVVLLAQTAAQYGVEAASTPAEVDITKSESDFYSIQVTTATAGYLILSEWAMPGWRATVNGQQEPIHTANYAFQAIWLPAGHHTVEIAYRPWQLTAGIIISVTSLLLAIGAAWYFSPSMATGHRYRYRVTIGRQLPELSIPSKVNQILGSTQFVIAIIFVAFALRAITLNTQELRGDEAFSYLFADRPLAEIVPSLIDEADPHPPLHYLILGGWMKLAGQSEFMLRMPSLVVGIILLPVLWQLGRRLYSKEFAGMITIAAALSPSLIWLSQDVRNQYTLALLFSTMATYVLLVRIWPLDARPFSGRSLRLWAAYALLAALTMYSHYYGIFALLAHGVGILWSAKRKQLLPAWIAAGLAGAISFAPWLWASTVPLINKQLSDPSSPKLATYLTQVGVELTLGRTVVIDWGRWIWLGLLLIAVIGFIRSSEWQDRNKRPISVIWISWLLATAAGIFLILFRRSTFNAFYISVATPAWLMVLLIGARQLWRQKGGGRWTAAAIMGAWIIATGMSLATHYSNDLAYTKSWGYRETTAHLAAAAEPNDIFIAHFPDPAFDYYFRDIDMPRTIAPRRPGMTLEEVEADLERLSIEYDRLWIVPAHRSAWDPENVAINWLESRMLQEQYARYDRLEIIGYRPQRLLDETDGTASRQLRSELQMNDVFITVDGRPVDLSQPLPISAVSADQTIRVNIQWEALADIERSYTAFVHLLAPDGRLIAQHDGIPVNGSRPTNYWETGERYLDIHLIKLPSNQDAVVPGSRLVVGLYTSDTVERQTFQDGSDAFPILQFVGSE